MRVDEADVPAAAAASRKGRRAGVGRCWVAWAVRAVSLPDGRDVRTCWLDAAGWHQQPVPDAQPLPGRFALPGLVDAHSHVSFGACDGGPVPLGVPAAERNRDRWARDGVSLLREAGGIPHVVFALGAAPGRPSVIPAGRHLAPAGWYFEGVHLPAGPADVVEFALAEVAAGARWVKLVADFPSAQARAGSAPPRPEQTYDLATVGKLITAIHAAGARVAAHVSTGLVGELVALGLDSVEHGTALNADTLAAMARRGTAWTPTLCAALWLAPDAPEHRRHAVAERRERLRELLPSAVRQGVPVLTGSDVVGSVPKEIALLIQCGLDPIDALRAATTTAIGFLGADAAAPPQRSSPTRPTPARTRPYPTGGRRRPRRSPGPLTEPLVGRCPG